MVRCGTHWYVGVHGGTLGYTMVRCGTQWYVGVHNGTHWYVGVPIGTLRYTVVRCGTQWYVGVSNGTLGYTVVHSECGSWGIAIERAREPHRTTSMYKLLWSTDCNVQPLHIARKKRRTKLITSGVRKKWLKMGVTKKNAKSEVMNWKLIEEGIKITKKEIERT